jgi:superfamily II DNA or RNA helicase
MDLSVRWVPALVDDAAIVSMAAAMPGPITAIANADPRTLTLAVLGSVVDTIVRQAAGMLDLSAPPPQVRTTAHVAEAFVTRLDGSPFEAPVAAGAEVSKRIDRWSKPLTGTARVKLVVQLDPPDSGDAWFLSVLGPGAEGTLLPIEQALADGKATKPLADELNRVERCFPALLRPGALRRGQVYLSQEEAWELMTVIGPQLEAAGFELRVPALSRKKPSPTLRLFTEPAGETVVGAHQLANVRWSVLFDDVELTAADIARLAAEARPLVRSHGKWVELDAVDLKEAAAALAERADKTKMTGAEILRHSVGLEGNHLAGGVTVAGSGWASDLLRKASEIPTDPITTPEGFVGELRHYQAEALAWLAFLHTVELGGCLALDMGLGKTPTMLAHLGRTTDSGRALVIAPPAVVGNWAREAERFVPDLKVLVHHGASRASGTALERAFARADVVITTYGTAVRDMDALSGHEWSQVVLDEAQAIKNHTSETAQQLRRLAARTRVALTGTPIENGLGDLWAILDFTNPGLVGTRPGFIAQMQGEGEAALRALNGILVFRRTKSEPEVAKELPDRIDELDHCLMTPEQIGLYQAVLDGLVADATQVGGGEAKQGAILAAITALKQICNHPAAYQPDDRPLEGRSGKLARLEEIVEQVFAGDEKVLIFTHFAEWGKKMAHYLSERTGLPIDCYHGGLARGARDKMIADFQDRDGSGALVLSLKAGGTGLNLTAANHVVLYDRWWNPAVEDQARDRAWRIGQTKTVVSHRLVCPGTVDERVEEVVAGKRHIADLILPGSSSLADLDASQLRVALGLREDTLLTEDDA